MRLIAQLLEFVRNQWDYKKLTVFGVLAFIWAFVPDSWSRAAIWYSFMHWFWLHIAWFSTLWGRLMLIAAGLALIWADNQRRGRKAKHDIKTVKGRTLQLRNDLQHLLDEAIARWPESTAQGVKLLPHDDSALKRATERAQFIFHSFRLRFAMRAETVYDECGLAGTANDGFMFRLNQGVVNADNLKVLIEDLNWMARHVD